ncbi:GAF domain-containing sensor histidine kinase [Sulfobacillus thermosulfidooxidans]|uniref:GAF domain-containing sensor histidine kinase n=1 Tax=Sulfobacillus thermosulfidooxidans TaxID=28034 RepID=UPI0006B4D66E|nr:GAF domain-containing sensor histidine kinase [Sulfobacillus thermosulfidooxidans]
MSMNAERIHLLKNIAEALNEATDIDMTVSRLLKLTVHSLGLQTAWIFRYDPARLYFVEMGASGLPPALSHHGAHALKVGWCECQDRFVRGRLHTAVNIVRCSRLRDASGDKQGLVFHASVPLRSQEKLLGILNVASAGKKPFSQDTLSLLRTIGYQVAVALDRSTLLLEQSRYADRLRALANLANHLIVTMDINHILDHACQQLAHILDYDAVAIFSAHNPLSLVAQCVRENIHEFAYRYDEIDPGKNLSQSPGLLIAGDVSGLWQEIPQTPYRIRAETRQIRAFHPFDRELLITAAWHIATAVENVRLYEKSRQEAQQHERRLLAATLHDSVNQRLFSAQLLTRSATVLWRAEPEHPKIAEFLQRISAQLVQSQIEMRRLIGALRPAAAAEWINQLKNDLSHVTMATGLHFDTSLPEQIPAHWNQEALHILKGIIDECLHNTLQHGQAHHVQLSLNYDVQSLYVHIEDDGKGFDPAATEPGYGSRTIEERVRSLGGQFSLHSQPGHGTRIVITLPLEPYFYSSPSQGPKEKSHHDEIP